MLFNSYFFLFCFFPIVFFGYYYFLKIGRLDIGKLFLAVASVYFYGYFKPIYCVLLMGSISANFFLGNHIARQHDRNARYWLMIAGIVVNLLLLGYFKYWNFFLDNLGTVGIPVEWPQVILPIGISFFTFNQIAFLVDAYLDKVKGRQAFVDYVLFVTFFPHLIAGPIVHHAEMMPQFAAREQRFRYANVAVGLTIFAAGLFKKVIIADSLSGYANPVFAAADAGFAVSTAEAWAGALAYTLQLYFDFSGYSDMAIGLARMFGIRFPLNFFSPYKAVDIVDFWRRWHMTLSRFLRDYVYIPLGGNRSGPVRRFVNLFLTMLIGGLWHGAGWTFVVWGALHGTYLIINHGWRGLRQAMAARWGWAPHIPRPACVLITFLAVIFAWVVFRATTIEGAGTIAAAMLMLDGLSVPADMRAYAGGLEAFGVRFAGDNFIPLRDWPAMSLWIGIGLLLVWFTPNVEQMLARYRPTISNVYWDEQHVVNARFLWRPGLRGVVFAVAALTMSVIFINRTSEFLYFQF
jgi:D-alanyl-lipoteichoic acid acyltransferase DltB (MBOAT superfamily)